MCIRNYVLSMKGNNILKDKKNEKKVKSTQHSLVEISKGF